MCILSPVRLFATPWAVAHQAPLSMGFSRQEYWSGLPLASLGDLSQPGIEPAFPVLTGRFFTTEPLGKPSYTHTHSHTHTLTHSFRFFFWGSPSYTHTETHTLAHTHTLRFFSLIGYYKTPSSLCFFPLTTHGTQTQVSFYGIHKVALDCNVDYLYEITWCLSLKV